MFFMVWLLSGVFERCGGIGVGLAEARLEALSDLLLNMTLSLGFLGSLASTRAVLITEAGLLSFSWLREGLRIFSYLVEAGAFLSDFLSSTLLFASFLTLLGFDFSGKAFGTSFFSTGGAGTEFLVLRARGSTSTLFDLDYGLAAVFSGFFGAAFCAF